MQVKDPEEAEGRSRRRAAERRKRRSELLEIPFSEEEGLEENLEKDWATDAEEAKSETEDESEQRRNSDSEFRF